jgi:hypothetical protein
MKWSNEWAQVIGRIGRIASEEGIEMTGCR